MKRLALFIILAGMLVFAPVAGATVATFDDLTPPTAYTGPGGGAYYNGSDGAGGFLSGDVWFTNNYNTIFGSWDGWAYSNTTDTTTAGYTNQWSAFTGGGVDGSNNYAVAYDPTGGGYGAAPTLSLGAVTGEDYNTTISGAYITNTTYAALSMLNGDSFAKKFGGATGNDEDWFKVSFTGITETGYTANSVEFYLADFRFADNPQDYIVDQWTWVDLSGLGDIVGLEATLSSSDVGEWGMNTPAYFAMDNLNAVPVPGAVWLLCSGLLGLVGIRRRNR
jgi:hypothetical protein